MDKNETYMSLPYDLSGSSSKNRFRLEILWGVCKIFDLYDKHDFCIIFDYKCDIEIHLQDSLEFYQLKTHKVKNTFTFNAISKRNKKTGKSILGKLFVLKHTAKDTKTSIKVALVSNAFFKLGKKIHSDVEELKFTDLDEDSIKEVKKALQDEFAVDDIDISNLHYIYTSMNLLEPENDVKGKITGSFEKIKKCEPAKPNALYRLIRDTVEEKACYELRIDSYEELVDKKGLTKKQFDEMLNKYVNRIDTGIEKTKSYIDDNYSNIKQRKILKTALLTVFESSFISQELQNKEVEIATYLSEHLDELPEEMEDITDVLLNVYNATFSIEYTRSQIYVFILLVIHRWEDGKYE